MVATRLRSSSSFRNNRFGEPVFWYSHNGRYFTKLFFYHCSFISNIINFLIQNCVRAVQSFDTCKAKWVVGISSALFQAAEFYYLMAILWELWDRFFLKLNNTEVLINSCLFFFSWLKLFFRIFLHGSVAISSVHYAGHQGFGF